VSRWAFILSDRERERVLAWVRRAPNGFRVEIKEPQRSTDQNSKLWACLTDISIQKLHHGLKLEPEAWKLLFMDALKREMRMVPNLDGNGMVAIGTSSSDLSKAEFGDLLEIIQAWGAENGVIFHDQQSEAA
jgi:NinB protein.